MSNENNLEPIRPELVASKLAALRNYESPEILKQLNERPRLVELLWFLQAMSRLPGGLPKFCDDLLAELPERIGTATMREVSAKEYTLEHQVAILNELPECEQPCFEPEA